MFVLLICLSETIGQLMEIGIGKTMGMIGCSPLQFGRSVMPQKTDHQKTKLKEVSQEHPKPKKRNILSEHFYESIRARLIVDQLIDETRQQAEFNFDYLTMLIVACIIAAIGLATNSAGSVVASMLVSV